MNRERTIQNAALDAEIEAILAAEQPLIPSSGFLASVMESVRQEATAPPALSFPWMRALPGALLVAGILGWSAFEVVRYGLPALGQSVPGIYSLPPMHFPATLTAPAEQAGWVALALGLSLLSWLFSCRLAGREGLL